MTAPRYEVLADNTVVHGAFYLAGNEVELRGWPRGRLIEQLKPLNAEAKAVFSYWQKFKLNPWIPPSPIDRDGGIYLPAVIDVDRASTFPPLVDQPTPGMPRYRKRFGEARFGREIVYAGDEFAFLGWPRAALMLEPLNDPANRIVSYFERNSAHAKLPLCPWCEFSGAPYLPELAPLRPAFVAGHLGRGGVAC